MTLSMVELTVADLVRSIRWYETLGLTLEMLDDANRFASLKDANGMRLSLKEGKPAPGNTLVYFEVPELPAGKVSDEGYIRVLLDDPDGHRIGLFAWQEGKKPYQRKPL